MSWRFFKLIGVATMIVAVTVLLRLATVPVEGRGTDRPGGKISWGEPDLQGIWRDDYQIPLQRPARYADQEFFTDEERAALDEQRLAVSRFGDVGLAPRGTEQDVGGAYNAVFTSQRHTGRRTSLIVDPPDGRRPALTPEARKRMDAIGEYQLALLQATDACKNNLPGCVGGQYGPPSPRRAETPPYYLTTGRAGGPGRGAGGGVINRSDGPGESDLL